MKRIKFFLFIIICSLFSCKKDVETGSVNTSDQGIFTKLSAQETGITFANDLKEDIRFNGLQYEYYYNGSGLAVSDFDNDGLKDLFFVSALDQHALYLNQGDLKFKNVSSQTNIKDGKHFSTGVTTVDINNDGWMDIYISNSGKFTNPDSRKNKLYINMGTAENGVPTFKEQSADYHLDFTDCSSQAAFFDYDQDGDLDMYLLNHYPSSYPGDKTLAELVNMDGDVANDRLLRNDNGVFRDVSKEAGIIQNRIEYGLGIAVGDVNNDGWPDLYISSDYTGKDHLYINNANGTFTDRILEATNHISFFSMGNDMADINNDGWLDIMTVDMMGESSYDVKTSMSGMNPAGFYEAVNLGLHHQYMYNTLQLNTGFLDKNSVPQFSEIAQLAGVATTDWSWAPLFFDMDNDGLKDLFVSNGIKRDFRNNDFVNYVNKKQDSIKNKQQFDPKDYIVDVLDKMPTRKKENYFFKNKGDLSFEKMNDSWGTGDINSSNGAVYADLDNDGDLDIVLNNTDDPASILKNNAAEMNLGNYINFKFKGSKINRNGLGARVIVKTDSSTQMQEVYASRGFLSAVDPEILFGLGKASQIDVEILWPDQRRQFLENVKANQTLTLSYTDSKIAEKRSKTPQKRQIFTENQLEIAGYSHNENEFDDYKRESLLPHKLSNEGPAVAVGDVNGDGLDDMYIGGALNHSGTFLIQKRDGSFTQTNHQLLKTASKYEDVAAVFIDFDQDNDLDLYVVSGGNENVEGAALLKDRIYLNDGKGNFQYKPNALPSIAISGSCVKPSDFDNDGDMDLFIGGRQIPGKYPVPARSYILENKSENGKIRFELAENSLNDKLSSLGMVTDALWMDLNDDGFMDLIAAGEWMPITVFENKDGKNLEEKIEAYGLQETNGWWFSLNSRDLDGDGDLDLVAGNLGLNYKYHASLEAPFEVYAADFDNSGTNDIVLGYYDNKNLVPLRGRQCSSEQMPFIKEKFPTYEAFGKATVKDIFNNDQLEEATHLKAKTFASMWLENTGGSFKVHKLPNEAQVSSINSTLLQDFDQDGNMDILMAGNLYAAEVETPRADASYGLFLKGDGKGDFKAISAAQSGIMAQGVTKSLRVISVGDEQTVLFAKNNEAPQFFSINSN
ncbi:VCBS repeat-containing protein [Flavimarina sp. Hel_I_48]|uniref:VCBS repeat-containing protein n=1 Tax=Flavimarina sp. Hel_I_48 TaxID=1392488 RepID=UPI0004DF7593|nr:VCBS repeat-containing protein [Flavimarina sp. Hel_I_48]